MAISGQAAAAVDRGPGNRGLGLHLALAGAWFQPLNQIPRHRKDGVVIASGRCRAQMPDSGDQASVSSMV
jgi:hypothetical protein